MAIAFVNRLDLVNKEFANLYMNWSNYFPFKCSDFHDHVHESDEWDDYSPCDEHFDTRYAIGTHAARSMRKLKEWSSLDAHPIYVSFAKYIRIEEVYVLIHGIVFSTG